jgi:AcrR family transcriptional regulator
MGQRYAALRIGVRRIAVSVTGDGVETEVPLPDESAPKARGTRESLLAAARAIFARDGFVDARIGDIAAAAGVSHGTFYTYFASKEAIFRELVIRLSDEIAEMQLPAGAGASPTERIEFANRTYIRMYRQNAALIATLEQASTLNEDIRQLRKDIRRPFLERNAAAIRRWQAAGQVDHDLDPDYAAAALGAMVERFMYISEVLADAEFDEELAVATLTRLWVGALDLPR